MWDESHPVGSLPTSQKKRCSRLFGAIFISQTGQRSWPLAVLIRSSTLSLSGRFWAEKPIVSPTSRQSLSGIIWAYFTHEWVISRFLSHSTSEINSIENNFRTLEENAVFTFQKMVQPDWLTRFTLENNTNSTRFTLHSADVFLRLLCGEMTHKLPTAREKLHLSTTIQILERFSLVDATIDYRLRSFPLQSIKDEQP